MSSPTCLICMDAFKGSLDAARACEAVAEGMLRVLPQAHFRLRPMADGGEGTLEAALAARPGGTWIPLETRGPRPEMKVASGYAWFADTRCALIEMARSSGLPLLAPEARDPMKTTTFGTGELIAHALTRGAREILLAIGGSATVEGGCGMAAALGWCFEDADGRRIPVPTGEDLGRIRRILPPPSSGGPLPPVEVLCDVDNPLCGPRGAAVVYGPQKGAGPAEVLQLDSGLSHLADCVHRQLDQEIADVPGAGAAGGLGAGALAFLGGRLVPGVDRILDLYGFDEELAQADCVITGEGCFDSQSLQGKVVQGILRRARPMGIPVLVLAGQVDLDEATWRAAGVRAALASAPEGLPLVEAMARSAPLLTDAAERLMIRMALT